jgi:hypothetical protein
MTDDESGKICPFMSRPFIHGETGPSMVPCQVECQCWIPLLDYSAERDRNGNFPLSKTKGYCGMMPSED